MYDIHSFFKRPLLSPYLHVQSSIFLSSALNIYTKGISSIMFYLILSLFTVFSNGLQNFGFQQSLFDTYLISIPSFDPQL